MKKNINIYKKRVEFYFESEYSDYSIERSIEDLLLVEEKPKEYWLNKIEKLNKLYFLKDSPPQNAAAHIAKIFRSRLKSLLKKLS